MGNSSFESDALELSLRGWIPADALSRPERPGGKIVAGWGKSCKYQLRRQSYEKIASNHYDRAP